MGSGPFSFGGESQANQSQQLAADHGVNVRGGKVIKGGSDLSNSKINTGTSVGSKGKLNTGVDLSGARGPVTINNTGGGGDQVASLTDHFLTTLGALAGAGTSTGSSPASGTPIIVTTPSTAGSPSNGGSGLTGLVTDSLNNANPASSSSASPDSGISSWVWIGGAILVVILVGYFLRRRHG